MPLRLKFFLSVVLTLTLVLIWPVSRRTTPRTAFRNVERRFSADMARVQTVWTPEVLHHYAADWAPGTACTFSWTEDRVRFDEMIDSASLRALDVDLLVLHTNLLPVVAYGWSEARRRRSPALLEICAGKPSF